MNKTQILFILILFYYFIFDYKKEEVITMSAFQRKVTVAVFPLSEVF